MDCASFAGCLLHVDDDHLGEDLRQKAAFNTAGANAIAVNTIGKLSILLTMFFSLVIMKEKFTKKSLAGLLLLTLGIVAAIMVGVWQKA